MPLGTPIRRHDDYYGRVSNSYMERCTNEKGLNMAVHKKVSAERKQRSINGDDGGSKAKGSFRLSAFPRRSCSLKTQLITFEASYSCCPSRI